MSLIHQAGLTASLKNGAARAQSVLAKNAAPPAVKPWLSWAVLAIVAFVVVVVSLPVESPKSLVPLAVAVFAMAKWLRAVWYNKLIHPGLHDLWVKSFMCARCGEVFTL